MKKLSLLIALIFAALATNAQLKLAPSGGNQKSVVTQYMGAHAHVTIIYNSPDVTSPQGQSRRGKIWGQLVPYGMNNLGFGISSETNKSPWRAGANENTIIKFSHDVEVQGRPVPAGKYGLHLIPEASGPWTLIFSKNSGAWGSYFYRSEDDVLRAPVTPQGSEYNEWLTFEFTDRQEEECTVALKWEDLSIPFRITLPNSKEIYVEHLRSAMENSPGFNWSVRNTAANYCLQNDVNLEEALEWQKATVSNTSFVGQENVTTLQTLAGLQMKLGQKEEGMATIKKAASHPTANVFQIHGIGRQLIAMGKKEEAMQIFQYNLEKSGDVWPVNVGLARGYSALGQYKMALKHAQIALTRAPDQLNRDGLTQSIEMLKSGQDIN